MFTWSQLGLHRKPIGLLDVAGYWQPLLAFLDHMVDERFMCAEHRDTLLVERDAATLLDRLHVRARRPRQVARPADAGQSVPNTRSPASPSPGRM